MLKSRTNETFALQNPFDTIPDIRQTDTAGYVTAYKIKIIETHNPDYGKIFDKQLQ
jgi:hypothetical protein